ncbi:MAG: dihydropteroate synthase [Alphaproteobacteria bacterium]|jgi:dihydropteroate synthase|nr:dihydropteroate synthase [Alphaproteobacteria bacterium]
MTGHTSDEPLPRPVLAAGAVDAAKAVSLGGGPFAFSHVEIRDPDSRRIVPVEALPDALQPALERLTAPRPPVAGLNWQRPRIMGVVNVTPDSFSDGGDAFDPGAAVARGLALVDAGADILDIGGESTRPGATPVDPLEEQRRIVPVIAALADRGIRVSVDTRHAHTMKAALDAGAQIVNDVTALRGDPAALRTVSQARIPVVLMHMQGEPQTMQRAPSYADAPRDVYTFLEERLAACAAAGIPRAHVLVDPGIGFGKSLAHNLQILHQVGLYHGLGCPVVVGVSRKRFIAALSRDEAPKDRVPGSLAAALAAVEQGVQMVRVHDVAETAQALAVWRAIRLGGLNATP